MGKRTNRWKMGFVAFYLLLGGSMIWSVRDFLFLVSPDETWAAFPAWFACVGFALLGFAFLVLRSIPSRATVFPWTYLWYYPLICLLGASGVYLLFRVVGLGFGNLYFFAAGTLAFLSGYYADLFWGRVLVKTGLTLLPKKTQTADAQVE